MNDFVPPLIDSQKLNSLERLRVYDNLMIDAERWKKAHSYHKKRQNLHYQSLSEAGIVCGLGVKKIAPPKEVSAKFRLQPWLKIEPGVAIDWEGNPIIVPQAIDFPLKLPDSAENELEFIDLYLVMSYRDPENLNRQNTGEIIQETFRLDQKTTAPVKGEVELCRVKWQPGQSKITTAQNVLFPQTNEIDLRYRLTAKSKAKAIINIFARDSLSLQCRENLAFLLSSISVLHPAFKGSEKPKLIMLRTLESLDSCHLFYLSSNDLEELNQTEINILQSYMKMGGLILVELSFANNIEVIANLIAEKFNFDSQSWQKKLDRKHPLKTQPFLFAGLPEINRCPIEIWYQDKGIALVEGELSAAWGLDEELMLSREEIRAAQEFGINLLHFGWYRRELTKLAY